MSRDTAMTEALQLKTHLTAHGVRSSIELQIGRPWGGDDWYSRKVALVNHHTAGSAVGNTPSLAICKYGRPGLPKPLCNGYGGRDHIYRIICMGLANHPGQGGPITLSGITIPKDSARISTWGTEWEHDGKSAWPVSMRQFMGASNSAILEWLHRPVSTSIEHSTWAPTRKIDRNTYTAMTGQIEILKYGRFLTTQPPKNLPAQSFIQEDDMITIIVTPDKIWYHVVAGHLVHINSATVGSFSEAIKNGKAVKIECDAAMWTRYSKLPLIQ